MMGWQVKYYIVREIKKMTDEEFEAEKEELKKDIINQLNFHGFKIDIMVKKCYNIMLCILSLHAQGGSADLPPSRPPTLLVPSPCFGHFSRYSCAKIRR